MTATRKGYTPYPSMPTGVSIHSTPPEMGEDARVQEMSEERTARYEVHYENEEKGFQRPEVEVD